METVSLVCVFLAVTVLFSTIFMKQQEWRTRRRRILTAVASQDREPPQWTRLLEILARLHQRMPTTWYTAKMTRRLEHAGMHVPPIHFLVVQELGALAGLVLFAVTIGLQDIHPGMLVGFLLGGYLLPSFWLNNRIKERRLTVTRDLPEVVDLLSLCVGAGSDFMTALNRIVREFRPCPVREELGILLQEVRVGKRRRDALRGFADRLQTPETSTFARTLIQVDRMGTGLAEALTILSEDMRLARYHWAERFAQQAPMKMLLPLIMSLGAAMMIVAGPILIQFMRGGLMSGPQMSPENMQGQQK